MSEILKSKLTILQIFCSFNATRLNSVIAAGDIMQRYYTFYGTHLDLLRGSVVI